MRLNYFSGHVKMHVDSTQGFGRTAEIAYEGTGATDGDTAIARRMKFHAAKFGRICGQCVGFNGYGVTRFVRYFEFAGIAQ